MVARAIAHLHDANADFVFGRDHRQLVVALQLRDGALRNQQRAPAQAGHGADASELAGPQHVARVGEGATMRMVPVCVSTCRSAKDDASLMGVQMPFASVNCNGTGCSAGACRRSRKFDAGWPSPGIPAR